MNEHFVFCVDFDGTIVKHEFPNIGEEVPHCIDTLKKITAAGHKIILYTMRSDGEQGPWLSDAVSFLQTRGVELWGVNENPNQKGWTSSPKVYANLYIDDAALGVPLLKDNETSRAYVDWLKVAEFLSTHHYGIETIIIPKSTGHEKN